jgi:hypothetical protein
MFRPLIATVQDVGSGALLAPDAVGRLPSGSVALGETALEAAVNAWLGHLQHDPEFIAAGRRPPASFCGVARSCSCKAKTTTGASTLNRPLMV